MSRILVISYKIYRRGFIILYENLTQVFSYFLFIANGVKLHGKLISRGIPIINVHLSGKMQLGKNFKLNNGIYHNLIGRQQPCIFVVYKNAVLTIGDNVGISCSSIVCTESISIGNNVKIGGNCAIYDTDFHSLSFEDRKDFFSDIQNRKTKPVIIEDDVFIGAHVTILKGVTIGRGAIVGAGSVVTKNIPSFEIWGGNPASFIRNAENHKSQFVA